MRRWIKAVATSKLFWVVAGLVGMATLVGLPAYVWGWQCVWDWLRGSESNGATIRNIGLVLAGLVALPLAIWRGLVAQRQANAAEEVLKNDRYQTGAEMLGHATLAVRLGGVYALQQLHKEFPDVYHVPIMRLFCSFTRNPTSDASMNLRRSRPIRPSGPSEYFERELNLRSDVQAIMEAISNRSQDAIKIEKADPDFQMNFHGADFVDLMLEDREISDLILIDANLSFATFSVSSLQSVYFVGCDLSSARFAGVSAVNTEWDDCNMTETSLNNAKLINARFDGCLLKEAKFRSADLRGARFLRAHLEKADFTGTDLTGAVFSSNGRNPALNLVQSQLDSAYADPDNPPHLTGVEDPNTGLQVIWSGKSTDQRDTD